MLKQLILKDVSYAWKTRQGGASALTGFSCEFSSDAPNLICGRSGSGKTTLALLCTGLLKPDQGEIKTTPEPLTAKQTALVFQFPENLFLEDSVAQEFASLHGSNANAIAQEWLHEFSLDYSKLAARLPEKLSAAEGRLTAIALQLSREPELLILDEPTIGLDNRHRIRLIEALKHWHSESRILLVVTHDLELMRSLGGEIFILSEGRLARQIQTEELLRQEALLRQYELI